MKGIHPSIASHRLNVFSTVRPVQQKIRHFHLDRQKVIRNEIDKLLESRFIREEKTAFITPHDLYCYKVMSFRLKNAGATYQRLMTKIFKPLIGHTVEVYIDDIVYGMKLNPSKCAFAVSAGKFLGSMVSQKGIEVSPDQIKAVMETPPPRNKKKLQRLTGKLVALGRFIARFTDELRPFFLAIRNAGTHGWTDSCQNAFEKIKHCLMHPPILSSHIPKEKLYMYLAVSKWAISAVLFRCPSPKEQKPIYYVSRALADVETRYSKMELTALALQSATQKLRPYFQAHPVIVLTDQPLRNILHKPDLTGRMLQWAIELSEFGIEFQPRLSMKGQVMADFNGGLCELTEPHAHQALELGSYYSPQSGNIWSKPSCWDSLPLTMKQNMRPSCPDWTSPLLYPSPDSGSTTTHNSCNSPNGQSKKSRELTIGADVLAGIAASLPIKEVILLPIHVQPNPSVTEISTCNTIKANQADGQEWTYDIAEYLQTGTLPGDLKQAHKVLVQAARFTLIGGHLYKRSFTGPYLRCLGHSEAQYVLAELHEGICGNHSRGRSLAHRAHSQGYYWPTMKKDAAAYVKRCDKCQRYAPIPHMSSTTLKSVSGPWPFAQWGMDIKKFLLVATDYFSKWVEAEAYASIKDKDVCGPAFFTLPIGKVPLKGSTPLSPIKVSTN
uniref:Retrovirus-related Pol polyprotein from transposon 17.6 n=1 Tax=Vitis vinifera TaxID=29760 RepID=A5B3Q3_VITVI|nr:hypothetical protein VITISV_044189 [Vitis vinifera]